MRRRPRRARARRGGRVAPTGSARRGARPRLRSRRRALDRERRGPAGCFARGRLALRTPAPGDEARDALRVAVTARRRRRRDRRRCLLEPRRRALRARRRRRSASRRSRDSRCERAPALRRELWIACGARTVRRRAARGRAASRRVRAARVELPFDLRPALDVAVFGGRVLALGRTQLLERADDGSFRAQPAELPPGATPVRVERARRASCWSRPIAACSSRRPLAGPWQRAAAPAGSTPALDVAIAGEQASRRGVRADCSSGAAGDRGRASAAARRARARRRCRARRSSRGAARGARATSISAGDPAARCAAACACAGWLPIVTLEGRTGATTATGATATTSRSSRAAIASSTTATTRDQHDHDVAVRLTWDLGDVAYNPEAIDVSREAREVIELRDDVLDEITQLYFERRRVLALRSAAAADPARPRALRLRADELAAGIDAWTGGWFGRRAASFAAANATHSPRAGGNLHESLASELRERRCVLVCCGALAAAPAALALPVISEVFYDAVGSDDGELLRRALRDAGHVARRPAARRRERRQRRRRPEPRALGRLPGRRALRGRRRAPPPA